MTVEQVERKFSPFAAKAAKDCSKDPPQYSHLNNGVIQAHTCGIRGVQKTMKIAKKIKTQTEHESKKRLMKLRSELIKTIRELIDHTSIETLVFKRRLYGFHP